MFVLLKLNNYQFYIGKLRQMMYICCLNNYNDSIATELMIKTTACSLIAS